jgi:hypothetical protein
MNFCLKEGFYPYVYRSYDLLFNAHILIQHVKLRFDLQPSSLPQISFYPEDLMRLLWPFLLEELLKIGVTCFIDYRSHRTSRTIFYKESIMKDIIKKGYIFQIVATNEQCIVARSHAYLSSTKHEYQTCFLCKVRKSLVCIKCGSCLLCHHLTEKIETRKPVFYIGIGMLFDIESPALSEIKR